MSRSNVIQKRLKKWPSPTLTPQEFRECLRQCGLNLSNSDFTGLRIRLQQQQYSHRRDPISSSDYIDVSELLSALHDKAPLKTFEGMHLRRMYHQLEHLTMSLIKSQTLTCVVDLAASASPPPPLSSLVFPTLLKGSNHRGKNVASVDDSDTFVAAAGKTTEQRYAILVSMERNIYMNI